ncbi:MAG: metallophosphoesterase [Planctomycetota bacterium]|jgi:bis(5'-nucleosyl)-tetraphosphatase (symmetrical)
MGRRIFVGDIQGCREPLQRLLDAVKFAPGSDRLLPAGDLVNKGPDSPGTLALLMQLGAEPVLGNHDLHWLKKAKDQDPAQRAWLQSQPFARCFDDVLLVHAGLHPRWDEAKLRGPLTDAEVDYLVNVRYCDADGSQPPSDWPPPGPPYRPWDDFYRGPKRVVFGHWARRGLVVRPQCVGLDTGCVYGGQLSAWIAEEDRIVQVDGWRKPGQARRPGE